MTVNELLKLTDTELTALTDKEIESKSYGITNFDFRCAGINPTTRDLTVIDYLYKRLRNLPEEKPTEQVKTFIATNVYDDDDNPTTHTF